MCPHCQGRKYIQVGEIWQSCQCADYLRFRALMRDFEVPDELWKTANWKYFKHADKIKQELHSGKCLILTRGSIYRRWQLSSLILKILAKTSSLIYAVKLSDLVNSYFDREDQELRHLAFRAPILWLKLDFIRKHKWNDEVLRDLLLARANRLTLITTPEQLSIKFVNQKNIFLG